MGRKRGREMRTFKAPFSKGLNKSAQLQISQQELPPLKIGKAQILTPRTRKKILKRLAHNIQTKAGTVSPGISLSMQFDSQSDTSTAANPTETQSQILDDEIQSQEEFDLELSLSKDKLDQLNTSHISKDNILDNKNAADDYESVENTKTSIKEGEIKNPNEESAKQPESENNANLQNTNLVMVNNLEPRKSISEPLVNFEFYDHIHQSNLMDQKVQRKSMIKARSIMKPKFKNKTKKHSSVIRHNTVNKKGKKDLIPLRKIKDKIVTQAAVDRTTHSNNKQVKDSKTFMKGKKLKSAHIEALNINQGNKSKGNNSLKRNKSKKEVKEDVMRVIQKMHKEIVQLLDRRTKMFKAEEKTNFYFPYSRTVAKEE